jgi:hypothetical protein
MEDVYLASLCGYIYVLKSKGIVNIIIIHFLDISIVLFFFLKQRFGDGTLSPFSGKSQLSWPQSIELVTGPEFN